MIFFSLLRLVNIYTFIEYFSNSSMLNGIIMRFLEDLEKIIIITNIFKTYICIYILEIKESSIFPEFHIV